MKRPVYSDLFHSWALDPEITFLNHGSFGATPVAVLKKQEMIRRRTESEPVRFFIRELESMWDQARESAASFLGAGPDNLVLVKNTTMGVNTVIRSLRLGKGDEVLFHSHIYGACFNTWQRYAEERGYSIRPVKIPWPLNSEEELISTLTAAIGPATRMLFIDHITSSTGLIYPVKEITRRFKEKGIAVFIDGAHAPGMLDLNIESIGCDYYTGNAHKWICSPKGSAILWVHPSCQDAIHPLQWSHVYDRSPDWVRRFFWPGTDDYSAMLCIPEAITTMGNLLPGGWQALRKRNRDLVLAGRNMILSTLGAKAPAPDSMIGHLSTIPLCDTPLPPHGFNYVHPVQERLFREYGIEVPVFVFPKDAPRAHIRISAQAYNHISQYEYLAGAIKKILG
ncbi:MAG: aminotransferase class V-fold PLP-dependent enzyme [Bacteroidia bacterium]|nr:aminotransferase class V-fold PLP-dependent enzyme [Bacteroidia bacterium]